MGLGSKARLTANAPWTIETKQQYWGLRVAARKLVKQLTKERAWQPLDLVDIVKANKKIEKSNTGKIYPNGFNSIQFNIQLGQT